MNTEVTGSYGCAPLSPEKAHVNADLPQWVRICHMKADVPRSHKFRQKLSGQSLHLYSKGWFKM